MTAIELIEKIENGSDILFDVIGYHMCVFTWLDSGIGIGFQNDDAPLAIFESAEELVNNYRIDGFPLSEIANAVIITDYT